MQNVHRYTLDRLTTYLRLPDHSRWCPAATVFQVVLAAAANCLDTLRFLVEKGADVNAKATDGNTALIEAASNGSVPVVQLLLDHGADMEAKNGQGQSAWLIAAMGNQLEVVEVFKKVRGAKPIP